MATGRSMGPKKKSDGTIEKFRTLHCPYCDRDKKETDFYVSTDPLVLTGRVTMCKSCCENIARRYNPANGNFGDCSQDSICQALERIDKPFIQTVWDSSVNETMDATLKQPKTNVWAAYIKNITSLKQYRTMRWRDGDLFKKDGTQSISEDVETTPPQEALEECEKNKSDIIRLIGYDPFDKESEVDKPLLYAQLIGYIDSEGNNDDMTRILDSIEIVRGYLQLQKLNDMSAKAFANLAKTGQSGEIKSYMDTKKKVADVISQLAEQSCISLKHTKNAKKGENTWTGKIKKLKDLNLREAEVNGFDIGTCRGMQQVMDMSNKSILNALHLDESEYSEMIAQQRKLVTQLTAERDNYKEVSRILLRENLDLKDVLNENELLNSQHLINLNDLYSCFSETNGMTDEENVSEEESEVDQNGKISN